jgi:hypothetical protein
MELKEVDDPTRDEIDSLSPIKKIPVKKKADAKAKAKGRGAGTGKGRKRAGTESSV